MLSVFGKMSIVDGTLSKNAFLLNNISVTGSYLEQNEEGGKFLNMNEYKKSCNKNKIVIFIPTRKDKMLL